MEKFWSQLTELSSLDDLRKLFSSTSFFHVTLGQWLFYLVSVPLLYYILSWVRDRLASYLRSKIGYHSTGTLDIIADLLDKTYRVLLFIAAGAIATAILPPEGTAGALLRHLFVLGAVFQGGVWLSELSARLIDKGMLGKKPDPTRIAMVGLLGTLARFGVWAIAGLVILDNFGVDITALVAGLGIGGVAVALAVQKVLGDLLSSVSMVLDKPFEVGDFIIVGDLMGTVERIGIKTTRLRSLSGEQLIFPNSDLLDSRIRNFKRMYERRVVFSLGVTYQTIPEVLREIPEIIKKIILQQESVRFDRAHFAKYGAFSLDYECVFWVQSSDYNLYMDIQQAIFFEIAEQFAEKGIEFAYPTQTIFLEKEAPSS